MTQFVHIEYATTHAGVERVQRGFGALKSLAAGFDGARGSATLLLAAIVSALLVVANQVVDTWTEGHLLAAWIVLWTVAFAAIALFATPARRLAVALRAGWKSAAAARRRAAEDRRFWDVALTDARVMADLSRAMAVDAPRDLRAYY